MGSTPALRSDVFSNPRRRDASGENSRPWRMPVGLHPGNEVRRVKRLGNQEMRVRIPPMGRSLRTASRHLSSPRLQGRKIAANAGRTTSPCKRQVAGSSPAGSNMGTRSSVGRAGGLSKPSSPRTELLKRRECRPGLHSLWFEKVLATSLSRHRRKLANADGNTSVEASACGSSPQVLIIPRRRHRLDGRMPVGLHGRAPAQAGGRRFDSASGQPDSSVEMSGHNSSPTASSAANAVGTTLSPVQVRPGLKGL